MRAERRSALRYWRGLPLRGLAPLLAGVFLTFAGIGFIIASWQIDAPRPWPAVLTMAAFSGMTAVLFVLGPMRSFWFIPLAIAFQMLGARGLYLVWRTVYTHAGGTLPMTDLFDIRHRLMWQGLCAVGSVVGGYIAFIRFMRREGIGQTLLRAEVELARDIHRSLVPPVAMATARFEVRGHSLPSSEVGGDLVDVFEEQGLLLASVADVSGHGVPAGTLMAMIKSALRLELPSTPRLESLLADLNRLLVGLQRPGRFVTLACLRFDAAGAADYALAGHLPILRIRASTPAVERFENPNLPLGVQADASFTAGHMDVASGDLFAIYTDGVIEVRDRAGREFGTEGLEALLIEHAARPLAEIEQLVFAAAERHGAQLDDQTMLLIRVR